jgi:Tol biopolymer transport system component/DNA-binding winged helix-turn-helix (wHTH) protein
MNDEIRRPGGSIKSRDSLFVAKDTADRDRRELYEFGCFRLEPTERKLMRGNEVVVLTPKAFDTLVLLVRNSGHLLEKDELIKMLWPDTFVEEGNLSNNIFVLRKALGEDPPYIETVPKRGYRFVGAVRQLPLAAPPRRGKPPERHRELASEVSIGANSRKNWLRIAGPILVGVACALAALIVYLRSRPRAELATLTAVPFSALPGEESGPTFSPDGSHVAFAWDGGAAPGSGGSDLYIKALGSETLLRLTQHPSRCIDAAWSPDGTQIAFHRVSDSDTGVYVVPALGGPERKLRATHIPYCFTAISWSPDGKWIAFVDSLPSGKDYRIYLLSIETLESKEIPHAPRCQAEWWPAFSSDGKQLAYECLQGGAETGIYSVPTSGLEPKLITQFSGFPQGIAWTADNKRLIVSNYSNAGELVEITVADGSLRKLPFEDASLPAISRKGDKLAYTARTSNINIWRKDLVHPQSAAVKLISSTRVQLDPQYSPDGSHIAFESTRAGTHEIWISDADGTNLVQVSNFKNPLTGSPHWSPDGKKIAFDSRESGHPEVYTVDISERVPRRLLTNVTEKLVPGWSRDGKWIYFVSNEVGGQRIYRCPANGGDAVALSQLGDYSFGPTESYDGETVYFTTSGVNSTLHMASVKHLGTESVLQEMPPVRNMTLWTLAPGGVYFVSTDASRSVRYFDFATKKVRQIFEIGKPIGYGLSVSPDGRWILYSLIDEKKSELMLVDHFR